MIYALAIGSVAGIALIVSAYAVGLKAGTNACTAKVESARAAVIERARETEAARRAAIDKELDRVTQDAQQDARRAADLHVTAERLRQHIVRLARATAADRPATPGSAPAAAPGLVLAQLYRGADEEAIELAQAFDQAHRAGLACERIHDALRATQ